MRSCSLKNQKGFTLVEIMAASGVSLILFIIIGKLFLNISGAQRRLQIQADALDLRLELLYVLSDRNQCTANFLNVNVTNNTPDVTMLRRLLPASGILIDEATGSVKNSVGKHLLVSDIRLKNDWRPTGGGIGYVTLQVELERKGPLGQTDRIGREISLGVDVDGGNRIQNCVAIGNKVDSPWTRLSNGNLVFDSTSNVGIGFNLVNPGQKLEVDGEVLADGYFHSSDRRLKKNIRPSFGLQEILKLRGVDFQWKKTGKMGSGFIAQEVEEHFPHLVATHPETGIKSVRYAALVGPLIEAHRDLREELFEIEEHQKELEKKINRFIYKNPEAVGGKNQRVGELPNDPEASL